MNIIQYFPTQDNNFWYQNKIQKLNFQLKIISKYQKLFSYIMK